MSQPEPTYVLDVILPIVVIAIFLYMIVNQYMCGGPGPI